MGTGAYSLGASATLTIPAFTHPYFSDPSLSGNNSMQRAWIRVGSADYHVASINFGYSAALVTQQLTINAIPSGADWEVHNRLSATDLDACIDQTVSRFRVLQEVGIPSVDGALIYTMDAAASPNTIDLVTDFYYYTNPSGSTSRGQQYWKQTPTIVVTATGRELRIPAALSWSQQLIMLCTLQMTLGADDAATVNIPYIPDDEAVLDSAAAYAYHTLINRSPGQEVGLFQQRRKEHAMEFTRRMSQIQADQNTALGFESDFSNVGPNSVYP